MTIQVSRNRHAVSISILSYLEVHIVCFQKEYYLKGAHALFWNSVDGKKSMSKLIEELGPWLNAAQINAIAEELHSQSLVALKRK